MSRPIDVLLDEYSASHQNPKNKRIHWMCIPLIFVTVFSFLTLIPLPFIGNMAVLAAVLSFLYFLRLSVVMSIGYLVVLGLTFAINYSLLASIGHSNFLKLAIAVFVLAWIGQFIGHKIEGKKPSFFKDIQFLLIGPGWLLSAVFKKWGIAY